MNCETNFNPPKNTVQPGQLIAGEFMLQKLLSEGMTGEVWRALEPNVGRLVQLRFIPPAFLSNPTSLDRLHRHLEAVQQFKHPHVVPTERFIERSENGAFLVSRFVEGHFLDEYAAQWIQAEGKFPFNLVFDVLRPVASALDEAKNQGLAHRSLAPRYVVVSQIEGIQVLGFDLPGIIREGLEQLDPDLLIDDSQRIRYLAPEQLLGQPASALSDQYSFAMIVAELLGNRLMFPSTDPEQLRRQILTSAPPMLPGHPDHVNASLQRALYKDPAIRFPSCIHFLDGLAGLIPVAFPPPYVAAETGPSSKKNSSGITFPDKSAVSIKTAAPEKPDVTISKPQPAGEARDDSEPSSPVLENVASFNRIASKAKTASAEKIASKIRSEKRFKMLFYFWNVMVLIACLVAVYVFRGHIGKVWKQRVEGEVPVQAEVENGNDSEKNDSGAAPEKKRRQMVVPATASRRVRKEKEENFDDENESPFPNIDDADATDEVRFLGTSGTGKKILFVVDASAVMGNGNLTPWGHVQKELAFSFKDLNRSQKFQVLYYNELPNLLPSGEGGDSWIAVSPETLKNSYQFLKKIGGSGLGDPAKALEKAISLRPDVVFFLSDQKSSALTNREIEELKRKAGNISINAVEIGEGSEPVRKSPVRLLAQTFQGEYKWINAGFHGLKR